jgi:mitofilin
VFGKIVGTTAVLGSAYGGSAYYATQDDDFEKVFTEYVPGAKETVDFIHDIQKNNDLSSQSGEWKKALDEYTGSAKDYGTKIQQTMNDSISYATDTYQTLTGQKEPPKLPSPVTANEGRPVTPKETVTTVSISSDKEAKSPVVQVTIEKPKPIVIQSITSDNATVRELNQIVHELASILNETGLSALGRSVIQEAQEKVSALNDRFLAVDKEQEAILKSLEALAAEGKEVEGNLDKYRVDAFNAITNTHVEAASTIVAREAQLKNQFEQTRAEMKTSFAEQLANELNSQKERLEQARANALADQSQQLQRRFVKQVKLLVEQERADRLAKLDVIASRFGALEKYTLENAKALDKARQYHVINVTLNSFHDVISSKQQQPFTDELKSLNSNSKDDRLIQTVLKTIPSELAEKGVHSISELMTRFEQVADEIRQVSLVPEDGGFGSHIISLLMSYLMFKKSGLVQGGDVESVLSRTEYHLKRDNIEYATRELNQLTGWPKRLAKDWIQAARYHLEVKQALEAAETQAVLMSLLEA